MSTKKQSGVWMDSHHATVVSQDESDHSIFAILAHIKGEGEYGNSSEHAGNNLEIKHTGQFFKEITSHMPNVDMMHITGTGQIQEEFAHYLAETPQYKNTLTTASTTTKMSDEALLEFFADKLT